MWGRRKQKRTQQQLPVFDAILYLPFLEGVTVQHLCMSHVVFFFPCHFFFLVVVLLFFPLPPVLKLLTMSVLAKIEEIEAEVSWE